MVCRLESPTDIVYVYDQQSLPQGVSGNLLNDIANLITRMFKRFPEVRSGVLTQVDKSVANLPIGLYRDEAHMKSELTTKQDHNLPLMLVELRTKSFHFNNGGRDVARKVAVLFINGILDNYKQLHQEAKRLKFNDNVEVFVVYFGTAITRDVKQIASYLTHDHVIHVTPGSDTESWKSALLDQMCKI